MFRLNVRVTMAPPQPRGAKAQELMRLFGISRAQLKRQQCVLRLKLKIGPGEIVLITGASGAGKSTLLGALYEHAPAAQRLRIDERPLADDQSAIDALAIDAADLHDRLQAMNKAALSDVFCMLQTPARLSVGQQARFRLAAALMNAQQLIFIDEFTAAMDRITALAAAYHLRKAATRSGKSFIVASCHDDILDELRPDQVIRL